MASPSSKALAFEASLTEGPLALKIPTSWTELGSLDVGVTGGVRLFGGVVVDIIQYSKMYKIFTDFFKGDFKRIFHF